MDSERWVVISADGQDLAYVSVEVVDSVGTPVPDAQRLVRFKVSGEGSIAGVDNGSETDLDPFKADFRRTYNGRALVVVQSSGRKGAITLEASSQGLTGATVRVTAR